jgi:hypothetical protein
MNILDAIRDEDVFKPFLGDRLQSWSHWMAALRCVYGLPIPSRYDDLILQTTGRTRAGMPPSGFSTCMFLTGRRCGKSKMASVMAAFEAAIVDHSKQLSPGERGVVPVISPTRHQSRICREYMRSIFETDSLRHEVASTDRDGFELKNGIRCECLTGDFRVVRGFSLVAAIIDETAFFGYGEDAKVKSDSELIRAVKPGLITTHGRLICISNPYARKGYCYAQYQRYFGNETGVNLVWNAPSLLMNPTLDVNIIEQARLEDPTAAASEFDAKFREDICAFIPRELVERLVAKGMQERLPRRDIQYYSFVDMSGARSEDATCAIAYRSKNPPKVILAKLIRIAAPYNPTDAVGIIVAELQRYGMTSTVGDNYGAEWVSSAFQSRGIRYIKSDMPKSKLYAELLPRLCAAEIELLDNDLAVSQIASLERRVRAGGVDIIDHPTGQKDDVANAIAGVCQSVNTRRRIVGAYFSSGERELSEGAYHG